MWLAELNSSTVRIISHFWTLPTFLCVIIKQHKGQVVALSAASQRRHGSDALHKTLPSQRWLLVISTISSVLSKGKKLLRSEVESLITPSPVCLSEPVCAPCLCLMFSPVCWVASFPFVWSRMKHMSKRFFLSLSVSLIKSRFWGACKKQAKLWAYTVVWANRAHVFSLNNTVSRKWLFFLMYI